ncbi:hypothetical protein ACFL2S_11415, partial [Thermodesulfobacteriota bacterium]
SLPKFELRSIPYFSFRIFKYGCIFDHGHGPSLFVGDQTFLGMDLTGHKQFAPFFARSLPEHIAAGAISV